MATGAPRIIHPGICEVPRLTPRQAFFWGVGDTVIQVARDIEFGHTGALSPIKAW